MKITLAQLSPALNKKIAPIYIVSGDDPLLKEEAKEAIRLSASHAGFSERLRLTPDDGHFSWDKLHTTLYAYSLLSTTRLIELDLRHVTPPKQATEILAAYAKQPAEDTVLLIDMNKLDDKTTKSAWYKSCEEKGIVVAIWPIAPEQMTQWVMTRAKARHARVITPEAAKLLAEGYEGNVLALSQALEKLSLLFNQQDIDVQAVKMILSNDSRYSLFDFVDQLLSGNIQRALTMLMHLQAEGQEPVLVLWAITRELRLMSELIQKKAQGHSDYALFQQYRIFAKRQPAVKALLARFTLNTCWQRLMDAAEIDRILKGAETADGWQALQLLSLKFISGKKYASHT